MVSVQVHPDKNQKTKIRREEPCSLAGSICPLSRPKGRVIYGGKRWVLRPERKMGKEVQERRWSGREFQTVGAEKLKARRPFSEATLGMTSKFLLEERRFEEGT